MHCLMFDLWSLKFAFKIGRAAKHAHNNSLQAIEALHHCPPAITSSGGYTKCLSATFSMNWLINDFDFITNV